MNILTDDIRQMIRQGWRVGIKENDQITVFEVVSRLGNHLKGDEKWVFYPKDAKKEDGPVKMNPRLFFDLNITYLVYCHSRTNGKQYLIHSLMDKYTL